MSDRFTSRTPDGTGTLELNITSDPANLAPARKAIESYCLEHGLSRKGADEFGLSLNEALANVTRHAYEGRPDRPVVVRASEVDDRVRVTIRDWGNGVNPDARPAVPKDPMVPGGLGLVCLRSLLDTFRFDPQPDGMLLTMEMRKSA